ncbi:nucleotide-binding protein, partial [Lacticaseibacillus paracasei subsp. paracasei CNCM I-4649]
MNLIRYVHIEQYNLLVFANKGDLGSDICKMNLDRFCEYTDDINKERFKTFSTEAINDLKSFPCLFLYEAQTSLDGYIGYITDIRLNGRLVTIQYTK